VNFRNGDRAPLLLVAPGQDHIIPASISRAAFKHQNKSEAKTELKEYPDRSHYIVGERGWEEVADHALHWAERNARAIAPN
jgi:alpha-beta hydrolase superfamily lysophospholipase